MISFKDYENVVATENFEVTTGILRRELEDRAVQLIDAENYKPAILFLEVAQALKLAEEKYDQAFRIMNGEEK